MIQGELGGTLGYQGVGSIVCTTNKHRNHCLHNKQTLQQTRPMDVAATSVRRSDRMHRFAKSGEVCPCRVSICPSFQMRRALLAFGSDSASEDRAREQVQRVADPSSQPPASHRSIRAWWPEEGSALEMAHSDADRSHTKGHA